jgi:uncharacterized protein (TIGR03435 family)
MLGYTRREAAEAMYEHRCVHNWPLLSMAHLVALLALSAPACHGQSAASPQPDLRPKPSFEVASVKESKSHDTPSSNVALDRSEGSISTGGAFRATNQPFIAFVIFAYKMKVSESLSGLMHNLPKWAVDDRFDIIARAESIDPSKDDLRLMLQSLLEERFQLRVHREIRRLPVYGLHPVKAGSIGPALKPHDQSSSCTTPLPRPNLESDASSLVGFWPPSCGDGQEVRLAGHRVREGGRDMTMSAIADWLTGSGDFDRPIVDRTALPGTFDFALEFAPGEFDYADEGPPPKDNAGPTLLEALHDQLGLRLKKERGSASLFFIDHLEYPSAN